MLDLTKEIKLDEKSALRYRRWQAFFYAFCFASALYVAYFIFFPTQEFNFSFTMLTSNKGNAVNPRTTEGTLITDGKFSAGQKNYFDTSLVGSFSKIKLSFTPNRSSSSPENTRIDLRKSYRAFLYPESSPIGFKNGTLVKHKNDYYLISEGKRRKFKDRSTLFALGFSESAFIDTDEQDLSYTPLDEEITDTKIYPADSLFKIDDVYYRSSTDGSLEKFSSAGAFHSQYEENFAIPKNADFLDAYAVAKNPIGFADGSLISYGTSAFIVSRDKIYPIGNPDIFLNQGYDWNDIIIASSDELSLYTKEKLFTLTSVHPDGTIFFAPDTQKWYQIENGQKHELPSEKIANSWLKKHPISVLAKSLDVLGGCDLQKETFGGYACLIPLNDSEDTAGKYYEFTFMAKNDLKINNLNLLYEKNMTVQNLKLALRNMILRIKARYGIQGAPQ